MRIRSQDGSAVLSIRRLDMDAKGDVHAKVRVTGSGFKGSNRSVWFEGRGVESFLSDLTALERLRQGIACLETMSPDECSITFRSFDRLGHIHVEVKVSRCIFFYGETDWIRCRIRYEIDTTALPALLQALRSEFQGKGT